MKRQIITHAPDIEKVLKRPLFERTGLYILSILAAPLNEVLKEPFHISLCSSHLTIVVSTENIGVFCPCLYHKHVNLKNFCILILTLSVNTM